MGRPVLSRPISAFMIIQRLITGLGEFWSVPKPLDDGHPTGLRRLPCPLVFAARIGPVDQLIAIDRIAVDNDTQGGTGNALEAHRHLAEVKVDVGDDFARLGRNSVQRERVVVGGQQIGCQHLVGGLIVGLIKDAVVDMGEFNLKIAVVNKVSTVTSNFDKLLTYDFIEVMSCPGGCIGGGGQPLVAIKDLSLIREKRIASMYQNDADLKIKESYMNPEIRDAYDCYINKRNVSLHTNHDKK